VRRQSAHGARGAVRAGRRFGHERERRVGAEPTDLKNGRDKRPAEADDGGLAKPRQHARASARKGATHARGGKSRFRIAAFAIIEHAGRVLLARRRDIGWWSLPGGGVEAGETVDEGLLREVREEVCVEVEIVRLAGVYSKPQKDEVVLTFLCHLVPGQDALLSTSDEVSEVGWFAPAELPDHLLPKHRQRVVDAMTGGPAAIVRAQRTSTAEDQGLTTGA
jgi:8-oxo-dGTP diphosphatase